ncbi:hypothetical protein LARI1_G009275 [Lachnellula arida]|uniref:DUF5672 domain-containing protein n=1 Tax=Lachnellula arida TaxID=1316785 RepID=A0A8T9B2G7_9HELO|nr:hypothetical protein LARI1_G009275 [Lachnellula arida]
MAGPSSPGLFDMKDGPLKPLQGWGKRSFAFAVAFLLIIWTLELWPSTLNPQSHISPSNGEASNMTKETPASSSQNPGNVAAIIETRPLKPLIPLILHFSSVLGPDWPIHIFTTQTTIPHSRSLQRALDCKRVQIRHLPTESTFTDRNSVSEFLTTPWFWQQLAPAGHVLLFQADSILCYNAPMRVEDFLQYDFVGAPIDGTIGQGMNGGLSLRRRKLMLEVSLRYSWRGELATAENPVEFEDQWYWHKLLGMGARMPSQEEASKFSVETIWYETPVGYHQVQRWNMDHIETVDQYCPEYRLATDRLIPG